MKRLRILMTAGCLLAAALPVRAETVTVGPEDNSGTETIDLSESGDIELEGQVRLNTLRFDRVGEVRVSFPGTQPRRLIDKSGRVNLPARVEPGVVYRDVTVVFQIITRWLTDEIEAPQP